MKTKRGSEHRKRLTKPHLSFKHQFAGIGCLNGSIGGESKEGWLNGGRNRYRLGFIFGAGTPRNPLSAVSNHPANHPERGKARKGPIGEDSRRLDEKSRRLLAKRRKKSPTPCGIGEVLKW
jgi:hypothetical protein